MIINEPHCTQLKFPCLEDPGHPRRMYNSSGVHDYPAQNAGFVGVTEEPESSNNQNNYQSSTQQAYSSFIPSQGYPGAASASTGNSGFRFENVDISGSSRPNGFDDTPFGRVQEFVSVSNRSFQKFLDSTTPHTGPRWASFGFLLCIFMLRVIFYQGFFVVAYALGIYLLNIFLLFLSPKFDPAFAEDSSGLDNEAFLDGDDAAELPNNFGGSPMLDEFRPFIRRLPEFKFWYNAITAVITGLVCTIFPFFDIPVFWPILLMYFVLLFALTMRRQIQHMIKYKYLPFDLGKKAYA